VSWYSKAAKAGSSYAAFTLANHFYHQHHYKAAINLYTMSNTPDALYQLGIMARDGRGCKRSMVQALDFWRRASVDEDAPNLDAMFLIGNAFEHGNELEKDMKMAFQHYYNAADLGHARAMVAVSWFYDRGEAGLNRSPEHTFQWLARASEKLDNEALYRLGRCYEKGTFASLCPSVKHWSHLKSRYLMFAVKIGIGCKPDAVRALDCWRRAESYGHRGAHVSLARIYATGLPNGGYKHVRLARDHLVVAALAGFPDAMMALSDLYGGHYRGVTNWQNPIEYALWTKMASEHDVPKATQRLTCNRCDCVAPMFIQMVKDTTKDDKKKGTKKSISIVETSDYNIDDIRRAVDTLSWSDLNPTFSKPTSVKWLYSLPTTSGLPSIVIDGGVPSLPLEPSTSVKKPKIPSWLSSSSVTPPLSTSTLPPTTNVRSMVIKATSMEQSLIGDDQDSDISFLVPSRKRILPFHRHIIRSVKDIVAPSFIPLSSASVVPSTFDGDSYLVVPYYSMTLSDLINYRRSLSRNDHSYCLALVLLFIHW
jgi:TPR repeat protein